ncbi:putative Rrp15p [Monocercomonoides exilis]|uniref:putative Rrp15p n=1 Tax=Monocercomonoides exilis TaxID=2049356 RepID=UPI00355A53E3|nr:putative Rrp15p [Monocercomonoides exilis]|eukprot:MONOS_4516.1-p1 / transcript=MONOS_4516.1 / gene=MONOS_4516 / organism=Monocercomonoides_exilis_PA203 / gene_product=unspecified product / transcript_product=unspecified product / location=Mono_scaffold00121:30519-31186(+) / protein_length=143 / sequence_SO=supercontig / SO=protein_coding / is_pseudo=false
MQAAALHILETPIDNEKQPVLALDKKGARRLKSMKEEKKQRLKRYKDKKKLPLTGYEPHPKGESDQLEKALRSLARKGVVKFFNALHKQQKKYENKNDDEKTNSIKEDFLKALSEKETKSSQKPEFMRDGFLNPASILKTNPK